MKKSSVCWKTAKESSINLIKVEYNQKPLRVIIIILNREIDSGPLHTPTH